MLSGDHPGDAAGRDQVRGTEVPGHGRLELVGGVAVTVGDQHLVPDVQGLTPARGALELGVRADLLDAGQDHVTGTWHHPVADEKLVAVSGGLDAFAHEPGGVRRLGGEQTGGRERESADGVAVGGQRGGGDRHDRDATSGG
ncbi:MAG: hypothetical protein LH468_12560 [Nocardioides sp.]|nr:hypothetical protein [Nocardioides sp.]